MSRSTVVSARLTREELLALRRVPGASDGARVRSLIHMRALSDAVSDKLSAVVTSDGEKTRSLMVEFSRRIQAWADQLEEGRK